MSPFQQMAVNYETVLAMLNILGAGFVLLFVGLLWHAVRISMRIRALEQQQKSKTYVPHE